MISLNTAINEEVILWNSISNARTHYPYEFGNLNRSIDNYGTIKYSVKVSYSLLNAMTASGIFSFNVDERSLLGLDTRGIERLLIEVFNDFLITSCEKFTVMLGEAVTGKYPFTRLWADRHISNAPPLFCKASKDVPGWVHNKFRSQGIYPKDGSVKVEGTLNWTYGNIDTSEPSPIEPAQDIDYDVKEIELPPKTKKRVVTKPKKTIDPSKVKKPLCAVHATPMPFDPVSGKWRCDVEGCSQVARPKRDSDDKSVLLGKGGLQLRMIVQGQDISVVLISDDNVALDITKLVDIETIIGDFDAIKLAQVASENGKEMFTIPVEKSVVVDGLKLTVMGADDLAIMGN